MGWRPYSSSACLVYTALLGLTGWILLDVGAKSLDIGRTPSKQEQPKTAGDIPQGHPQQQNAQHIRYSPVNPHDYHMMINNPRICGGKDAPVRLLVAVASSPEHHTQRVAIRETWGNPGLLQHLQVKLVFLLANPYDSRLQTQVTEESRTYGDILQEDFKDSYLNLTLKTVMGLKWAYHHCPQAEFFMKTDDDMYVNLPHLMASLGSKQRWVGGCIKQRKAFLPVNAPPGLPMPQAHPDFVAGAGYVVSGDIISPLYSASLQRRVIPVEDVYVTGHLAQAVGAHPPHHDERFSCGELVPHDCLMTQLFIGHKIAPTRMRQIWEKLNPKNSKTPCGKH